MNVSEIFSSIQGEGPNIGTPAVFLRLAGCNLRCKFCDSTYAYKGNKMDISVMVDKINKLAGDNIRHIVITGGEPTLQFEELKELISKLQFFGWRIELETNGTIWNNKFQDYFQNVSVSPKKEHINKSVLKNFKNELIEICGLHPVFKFVCEDEKNYHMWKDLIYELNIPKNCVYMMPEGTTHSEIVKNSKWLIPMLMKDGFKYSPRLHIHIWGKKRGV